MSDFPKVHRVMGTLFTDHVNAFVVELENAVVVVDTTLTISSARELRAKAESFGKPLQAVLLTHGHPDHYTGLVAFGDLPCYSSQGCLDFVHQEDILKSATFAMYVGEDYPATRLFPNHIVQDGDTLTFDGVNFTFHDVGPAESSSDGMWRFEKDGVQHIFVGDVVANDCHSFFRDGHVHEWNKVLAWMQKELDPSTLLYFGHGETPMGMELVEAQLGYNHAFINAVDGLANKSIPVTRAVQDDVIAAMKRHRPTDVALFMLDFELGETIADLFPNRGFGIGRGRELYMAQLTLMSTGRIDELLLRNYHKDAVMVAFDCLHRGRAELKKYYVDTLKIMGQVTFLNTEYFFETEDVILFKSVITSEGRGTVHADNAFFIKDGKIYRHQALTLLPDMDYDKLGTKWKA